MTDTTEFEIKSRKIDGAKYVEELAVPQKSAAEFLALIDEILATPGVAKFRWTQYTPYFNDGEPCEFGLGYGNAVLLDSSFGDLSEIETEYSYQLDEGDDKWFSEDDLFEYGKSYKDKTFEINGQSTEAIYNAIQNFEKQFDSFESVAKSNFGEHAEVTATSEGFEVEFYEHD